jgi:hypothetical protein
MSTLSTISGARAFATTKTKSYQTFFFEYFLAKLSQSITFPGQLAAGVDGIRQLLQFTLPNFDWSRYMAFGGVQEVLLKMR